MRAILIGVLANAHLEISLKRPSAMTSWREIVDIDLDLVGPKVYLKCPFLMLDREIATKRYAGKPEAAKDDFPFLKSKCHEFKAAGSLMEIVEEDGAIDKILAPKAEK
jgi:hypothetical protein